MTAPAVDAYDANQVVRDGQLTAPRWLHHVIKALVALAIYTGCRDVAHLAPLWAATVACPGFLVAWTIKEWVWPSDFREHSYPFSLRALDFLTDGSCAGVAYVAAFCAERKYLAAALAACAFVECYRRCRHGARP